MTQLILLNDDGSVKCRKPLPSIVDQSTIKGDGEGTKFAIDMNVVATALDGDGTRANAGKLDADLVVDAPLSGAGRSDSHLKVATATADTAGVVELTGAAQIPAEANRDDDAITPAAVSKLLKGIKPVGSTGGASAEQNAFGIEVTMLHNVSCTGGTGGSPKFTIPMAGGGGCVVDVGAWGGDVEAIPAGTVLGTGISGCFRLPEKGLYQYVLTDPIISYGSPGVGYVYNAGYKAGFPGVCTFVTFRPEQSTTPTWAYGPATPGRIPDEDYLVPVGKSTLQVAGTVPNSHSIGLVDGSSGSTLHVTYNGSIAPRGGVMTVTKM